MRRRRLLPRSAALLGLAGLLTTACAQPLPEAGSPGARLYTQYCSGSGCHGPIPPGRATAAVWEMQYERMLGTMREAQFPLPSGAQTDTIMVYLRRNAEGAPR